MKLENLKQTNQTLKSSLENTKSPKGITLIALVVTIIVLLILAGVSINAVFSDSGIIKKAQDAQNKMNEAIKSDMDEINALTNLLDNYIGENGTSGGETETPDTPTLDTRPLITDSSLTSNNRTSTESSTVIAKDIKGNQVVVPGGFKISADSGTSVQQGVVIEDATGNQFVWVPVSNIDGSNTNPIILDNGTEKVITLGRYTFDGQHNSSTGIVEGTGEQTLVQKASEYAETTYENVITNKTVDTKYRIVDLWGSSRYHYELSDKGRKGIESTGLDGENATAKDLETFINKTRENKGYYIARYEASYGSGYNETGINTAEKYANAKPLSKPSTANSTSSMNYVAGTLWNYITQPQAAKVSQNMYSGNSYVESDLINSYAWDTAIVYIQEMGNSNYANQNRGSNTSLMDTGSTGDEKCKIFDMAGNEVELTTEYCTHTEGSLSWPITCRGGRYDHIDFYTAGRPNTHTSTYRQRFFFPSDTLCKVSRPLVQPKQIIN